MTCNKKSDSFLDGLVSNAMSGLESIGPVLPNHKVRGMTRILKLLDMVCDGVEGEPAPNLPQSYGLEGPSNEVQGAGTLSFHMHMNNVPPSCEQQSQYGQGPHDLEGPDLFNDGVFIPYPLLCGRRQWMFGFGSPNVRKKGARCIQVRTRVVMCKRRVIQKGDFLTYIRDMSAEESMLFAECGGLNIVRKFFPHKRRGAFSIEHAPAQHREVFRRHELGWMPIHSVRDKRALPA